MTDSRHGGRGGFADLSMTAHYAARPTDRCESEDESVADGTMVDVTGPKDFQQEKQALLSPVSLHTRSEVLARPSVVRAAPGVYAWYFDEVPAGVPTTGCHGFDGHTLLYVGISPKEPSSNGRVSKQSLRTRVQYHYRGNAEGSTLRLTLGTLLSEELGIKLRRVGSGTRMTFSDGEAVLSAWMERHARVALLETPMPWMVESHLIAELTLPLNLDQNAHSPFRAELSQIRSAARAQARDLPVLPK